MDVFARSKSWAFPGAKSKSKESTSAAAGAAKKHGEMHGDKKEKEKEREANAIPQLPGTSAEAQAQRREQLMQESGERAHQLEARYFAVQKVRIHFTKHSTFLQSFIQL